MGKIFQLKLERKIEIHHLSINNNFLKEYQA